MYSSFKLKLRVKITGSPTAFLGVQVSKDVQRDSRHSSCYKYDNTKMMSDIPNFRIVAITTKWSINIVKMFDEFSVINYIIKSKISCLQMRKL